MLWILSSSLFVGFVHSLAPAHWLPVALIARSRKWSTQSTLLGALVAAAGHILVSVGLGILAGKLGAHYFLENEAQIESYAGLLLLVGGVGFALYSWLSHRNCREHAHHGPSVDQVRRPFVFLFLMGFAPCVAVLPIFAAAVPLGAAVMLGAVIAFSAGVLAALLGASYLFTKGLSKVDHPFFEHYGDVLSGLGIAALGVWVFFGH